MKLVHRHGCLPNFEAFPDLADSLNGHILPVCISAGIMPSSSEVSFVSVDCPSPSQFPLGWMLPLLPAFLPPLPS
jgi:hypothetical protein